MWSQAQYHGKFLAESQDATARVLEMNKGGHTEPAFPSAADAPPQHAESLEWSGSREQWSLEAPHPRPQGSAENLGSKGKSCKRASGL